MPCAQNSELPPSISMAGLRATVLSMQFNTFPNYIKILQEHPLVLVWQGYRLQSCLCNLMIFQDCNKNYFFFLELFLELFQSFAMEQSVVQVWRWSQQYQAQLTGQALPEMMQLIDWLKTHIPPDDSDPSAARISHGDYRWGSTTHFSRCGVCCRSGSPIAC